MPGKNIASKKTHQPKKSRKNLTLSKEDIQQITQQKNALKKTETDTDEKIIQQFNKNIVTVIQNSTNLDQTIKEAEILKSKLDNSPFKRNCWAGLFSFCLSSEAGIDREKQSLFQKNK